MAFGEVVGKAGRVTGHSPAGGTREGEVRIDGEAASRHGASSTHGDADELPESTG